MDEQAQTAESPPEQTAQAAKREFLALLKLAVIFLVLFWALKSFVIEGYEVQGDSMTPTLNDRERILVFKLPHELSRLPLLGWLSPFGDSDIIVFEGEGRKRYVKRVVAHNPRVRSKTVDADTAESMRQVKVEYDGGIVRVNNWQIDESAYLPEAAMNTRDSDVCHLEPGEFYVLGDHRQVSKDSRAFRAVSEAQVVGRAILRFWPLSEIEVL